MFSDKIPKIFRGIFMTNQELERKLASLVREERQITKEILLLVAEAERRKLHLERGFSSMVKWLIHRFQYSESAAVRRVNAARVLVAVPGAEKKLEEGKLSLTNLSKVQSAIRAHEKVLGPMGGLAKAKVVGKMEGLSELKAEKAIFEALPAFASSVKAERRMQINAEETRLALNFPQAVMEDLEKARDLLSHKLPAANFSQVIAHLLKNFLKQRATGPVAQSEKSCTYKDPQTGRICGSTYQLEIDHIKPRALGGTDAKENLRVLCRQHNQFMAEKILGRERANAWRTTSSSPSSRRGSRGNWH